MPHTLVLLRNDLRLHDNAALSAALHLEEPTCVLYILDEESKWKMNGRQRAWLYHSLQELRNSLLEIGLTLVLKKGKTLTILNKLLSQSQVNKIFLNRASTPFEREQEQQIEKLCAQEGISFESFKGSYLIDPAKITTKKGSYFKVFTPFYKACLKTFEKEKPRPVPKFHHQKPLKIASEDLDDWNLVTKNSKAESSQAGEKAALKRLKIFIKEKGDNYKLGRDFPAKECTSKLSAHLHFGEISASKILSELDSASIQKDSKETFIKELFWREFANYLLYHYPELPEKPFDETFKNFYWKQNSKALNAWKQGETGYPIVDAGMRELLTTGDMHNRVRMIVASFLIKDLQIHWIEGEKWFWEQLLDADLASNSFNWQWVAGCGADAAPYFRIFNPVLQGEKFDSACEYVRRWVPELAKLPNKWIHKPWLAPQDALKLAQVQLGKNYPKPIVDHNTARKEALKLFQTRKRSANY